jgi:NADH:ubiquinone oxidoreductase subunit 3 (subunit A)
MGKIQSQYLVLNLFLICFFSCIAFIFVSASGVKNGDSGMVPLLQLFICIPNFILSCISFFLLKKRFKISYLGFLLLPIIFEIIIAGFYFGFHNIFSKSDIGFLERCFIYSILCSTVFVILYDFVIFKGYKK